MPSQVRIRVTVDQEGAGPVPPFFAADVEDKCWQYLSEIIAVESNDDGLAAYPITSVPIFDNHTGIHARSRTVTLRNTRYETRRVQCNDAVTVLRMAEGRYCVMFWLEEDMNTTEAARAHADALFVSSTAALNQLCPTIGAFTIAPSHCVATRSWTYVITASATE